MKNSISFSSRLLSLLIALIFSFGALSCGGDSGGDPNPGLDGEAPQYAPRAWDGQKRAGVFYEIFVRSFADSDNDGIGDLKGVTDKLDYLHSLGVAGIWLTPINPSPSYHGYDVEDYTAVNPQFGTMQDFDNLISKANSLGIKVILDFVINHTSKTHPWFLSACSATTDTYRDYFLFAETGNVEQQIEAGLVPMTKVYNSWQWHNVAGGTAGYQYLGEFSDWMPDLNYGPVETAENSAAFTAICDAARFWMAKGVAGFRLDAVKHIYQDELSDENPRFLKKFHTELQRTDPGVYMVGEALTESFRVAPYFAGLPAMFEFSGWWNLEGAINSGDGKNYTPKLLQYRQLYGNYRADFIQATKLSNHDEDRARSKLSDNLSKCKLAASVLMTIAGSPYMYYGEEIGMLGMKGSDDRNVREPFLWDYLLDDPYRTTWMRASNSTDGKVTNAATQARDASSLWNVYKPFIPLRNTYPALAQGEMSIPAYVTNGEEEKNLMVFYRMLGGEKLLVVHNFSGYSASYTFRETVKTPVAGLGNITVDASSSSYKINMPAYSTFICEI